MNHRLNLYDIDDEDLRLYDRPVAEPPRDEPPRCPECGRALLDFAHLDRVILMCEACRRVWPTCARADENSLRAVVKKILPLAEIEITSHNMREYRRVYYARNRRRVIGWVRAYQDRKRERTRAEETCADWT